MLEQFSCSDCAKWMNHSKNGCPREVHHVKNDDPLCGIWTGPSCNSPICEEFVKKTYRNDMEVLFNAGIST